MEGALVTGPRWSRSALDEKRAEVADLFARHGVVAAYVFGSLARGRDPAQVTDRSDLDLAVLLPARATAQERVRAAMALERDLWDLFGRGDIDVVVANDAPLLLRHRIVRERDVIYGQRTPERVGFDWRTIREYLDTQPLRNIRYAAILRRAREGRLGDRSGTGTAAVRRAGTAHCGAPGTGAS